MNRSMTFTVLLGAALATIASSPYTLAAPVVLPGVTNLWSFDEGSGNTVADSVGGNDAGLHNWAGPTKQWITGVFGGALNFNQASQYGITAGPIAASSADQFSVSFWSRADVHNQPHQVLLTAQGDNWINNQEGIGLLNLRKVGSPDAGVWEAYSITVDRNAKTAAVYKNGVLQASGSMDLAVYNAPWVFGHNENLGDGNNSYSGALDNVQFYDRVLTPSEIQALATRPEYLGLESYLVAPSKSFGAAGGNPYDVVEKTVSIDVTRTDWIAWNPYADPRAVDDATPGVLYLGNHRPGVDDFINLTVTNPLGQSLTFALDQNGTLGEPFGQMNVIFGTAANAPDAVRGDNFGTPQYFNEAGQFDSIFTVSGEYKFSFAFGDIGGLAGYPDVYLLVHTVPEPSTAALAALGAAAIGLIVVRQRRKTAQLAT